MVVVPRVFLRFLGIIRRYPIIIAPRRNKIVSNLFYNSCGGLVICICILFIFIYIYIGKSFTQSQKIYLHTYYSRARKTNNTRVSVLKLNSLYFYLAFTRRIVRQFFFFFFIIRPIRNENFFQLHSYHLHYVLSLSKPRVPYFIDYII